MTTLPMLVGLVAVLATAVHLTAGPASSPSTSRDRRRRIRMLARSPQRVSGSDVEHLLTASLSAFETDLVRRWVELQAELRVLDPWLDQLDTPANDDLGSASWD